MGMELGFVSPMYASVGGCSWTHTTIMGKGRTADALALITAGVGADREGLEDRVGHLEDRMVGADLAAWTTSAALITVCFETLKFSSNSA